MKTISLLRHAKSDWDDSTLDDHERPLNARGRSSAPRMGRWIAEHLPPPDLILSSTAERTRETVALAFPRLSHVQFDEGLYLAPPGTLFDRLTKLSEAQASVLLVGHNPGMAALALFLARADGPPEEEKRRRAVQAKFPTAAFASLEMPTERWRTLQPGTGQLTQFVTPKDL